MSDTLSIQSRLIDIRLRVLNREDEVSPDEYRDLLAALRNNRDATAKAARGATAAARKARKTTTPVTLDLNTLFGKSIPTHTPKASDTRR